ncbi:MAG: hypothetical protein IJ809_05195 [Clostridia bacterium]|nr:hypothetical protein [Clostridia bacterium]
MKNTKVKRGVSLVVLVVTVIVLLILTTMVVVNSDDSRKEAKRTYFIETLTSVEEAVRQYYLVNGSYPIPKGDSTAKVYNKSEVINVAGTSNITDEIILNGDENASFYVVNMSLLDLTNITMGNGFVDDKNNYNKDVFVVSSSNFNAYYLKGVSISGTKYYSLSEYLTGSAKVLSSLSEDSSITNINSAVQSGRITVEDKEGYTNELDTKITLEIKDGETVEIATDNHTSNPSVSVGLNTLILKDVLTEEQKADINANNMYVIRIKHSSLVVEEKIAYVTNLSTSTPVISSEDTVHYYVDENTISFLVTKGESDIEYVKYDYYNVFDINTENGYMLYHQEINDVEGLVNSAKENGFKVNLSSDNMCTISVPKDVRDILVVVKDKAGNVAYMSKTVSTIYAEAIFSNITETETKIKSNVIAPIGTSVNISYSTDNVTYSESSNFTTSNAKDKLEVSFSNIASSYVYVKTVLRVDGADYSYINKIDLEGVGEYISSNIESGIETYTASTLSTMTSGEKKLKFMGAYVTDFVSSNGYSSWRIFNADNEHIYLITDDYIPVSLLASGHGFSFGTYNTDYCVYSSSRANFISSLSLATSFNGFKDDGLKASSIRVPNLVDFSSSYNSVEHSGSTYNSSAVMSNIYYASGSNDGYNVGTATNPTLTSAGYIPLNELDNLWVKTSDTKAEGYILNAPSSASTDDIYVVTKDGLVSSNSYSSQNLGLRLIAVLDSNVTLKRHIENGRTTYTIN